MFSKATTIICSCNFDKSLCYKKTMLEKFTSEIKRTKRDINCNGIKKPKTVEIRKEEVMAIRNRFPTKIPVIVQRFSKETNLPQLDKSKFLVPQEITMSQFLTIIRNRMHISSSQALYLLINNRSMVSLSLTLAEVYTEHSGPDGFLYVTYASQEMFGCPKNKR
ncbi:microtubule-associated proteins 1A/1B light chain 3C-like [Agrilus planipennis]|uniref:Microtubule-associated proteins 1A/1B light chain 3C-like n=1 Tax=Agrilus planipennis TaxID=224129 RepID=A0A7F5RNJ8_AGRPL|nr:microtubule-associated proteins 1A/1B light chain 3C-like [Agrilus planipennis]